MSACKSAPNSDELDVKDMSRLSQGHDSALNSLMERHGGKLFDYLLRCLQDKDDATDLAQETFVKLYQSRARFDPGQKFLTWLYAIAGNLVKDRYRWRSRHPEISLDAKNNATGESYRDALPEDGPSPNDYLQAGERAEAVRRAVAGLPEELRQPLILAEYEERSHAEIGAMLGCSAKAVETRIYRARRHLRSTLAALLQDA